MIEDAVLKFQPEKKRGQHVVRFKSASNTLGLSRTRYCPLFFAQVVLFFRGAGSARVAIL